MAGLHVSSFGNEREFVGRWQVRSSSDEYLRTARHMEMALQSRVIATLASEQNRHLLSFGIDELLTYLKTAGFSQEDLEVQRRRLSIILSMRAMQEQGNPTREPSPVRTETLPEQEGDAAPFFIAINVGSRRLRRLHRTGGCGTSALLLRERLPIQDLKGAEFDLACRHCWPHGESPTAGNSPNSSSSESSCSTELADSDSGSS